MGKLPLCVGFKLARHLRLAWCHIFRQGVKYVPKFYFRMVNVLKISVIIFFKPLPNYIGLECTHLMYFSVVICAEIHL